MVEVDDYFWTFPLIENIYALITLLTPAANGGKYYCFYYIWILGLGVYDSRTFQGGSSDVFRFADDFEVLFTSIASSLITLFWALIVIKSTVTYKKDVKKGRNVLITWLIPSTILIIISVVFMIWIEFAFLIFYELNQISLFTLTNKELEIL